MIFLTIGTHEPFDRLVEAVDKWCRERGTGADVFGQITNNGSYTPEHFEYVARLDAPDFHARVDASELMVSHAGMGSIITALSHGKPIVILPRRGHLAETRNDHQYATMKRFMSRPGIFAADQEDALPSVLDSALDTDFDLPSTLDQYAETRLTDVLAKFIHEDS